jgi:hypothetical protein
MCFTGKSRLGADAGGLFNPTLSTRAGVVPLGSALRLPAHSALPTAARAAVPPGGSSGLCEEPVDT